MTSKRFLFGAALLLAGLFWIFSQTAAHGRGGGGSGRGGGGGARGGGGGFSRPSMGPVGGSRPSSAMGMSRPSGFSPGSSRPSFSNVSSRPSPRPANVSSPSLSGVSRPNFDASVRPSTRPSAWPASGSSRPSLPDLGATGRPGLGNLGRPEIGLRPASDRPGLGNLTPGGDRRPGPGEFRPGDGTRPERPFADGDHRPDWNNRPVIGPDRPDGPRPGDNGHRPDWGYRPDHGNWANDWYDHHINPHHHGWYHGPWTGHWGNYWYVPLVYGATAWGLNAILPSWGYSYAYTYSNPYYVASPSDTGETYDYSQPVVVASETAPAADASATPQQSPQAAAGYELFDQARQAFGRGDYRQGLTLDEQAIQKVSNDPVLHEFGALCLFALGEYDRAAAVLNALLAVAPGMDWTTMASLYPSVDVYTQQLRALEAYVRQKPGDAPARFVLAYHYLVAGHNDAAVRQLRDVAQLQPGDQVTERMLAALSPPPSEPAPAQPATAEEVSSAAPTPAPSSPAPSTDLVGRWRAQRDTESFDLSIDEAGKFTWKATPAGKPPVSIAGQVAATADTLVLESQGQGTMVARVNSAGPDRFQFVATDGPPGDKGLTFQRVAPGN